MSNVAIPIKQRSYWTILKEALLTGASYMMPLVIAGGLLIALSFAIGGKDIVFTDQAEFLAKGFTGSAHDWAYVMFAIGAAAFGFLVPVLSGFLAYAIGGKSALAAGLVGGAIAGTVGAGYLGGIITGILAGTLVFLLKNIKLPKSIKPTSDMILIPLVSTFIVGGLMLVGLGGPIRELMTNMNNWLTSLGTTDIVMVGLILGLMMAFDMGGPINKVAYTFAAAGLTEAGIEAAAGDPAFIIMASVMAAGMVPPIALGIAALISKKRFTKTERTAGIASILLGLSFITEGAIPYAVRRPLKVIPSIMLGSATAGALVAAFGSSLQAPHGGIWVSSLIQNLPMFLLAVAIGTAVSVVSVLLLTSIGLKKEILLHETNEDVVLFGAFEGFENSTYASPEKTITDKKTNTKNVIITGSIIAAVLVGGITSIALQDHESKSSTIVNDMGIDDGSQVVESTIIDINTVNGQTVDIANGGFVDINVGEDDPAAYEASIYNPSIVSFTAGSKIGDTIMNPSLQGTNVGSTQIDLFNIKTGSVITFTVNVM